MTFFPFFVLGSTLTPTTLRDLRISRWAAVGLLLATLGMWLNLQSFTHQWLWGSQPYAALTQTEWFAGLIRLSLLALGLILGLGFLFSLVPDRTTSWTALGPRILYVYLWHGFAIKGMVGYGFAEKLSHAGDIWAICVLGLAAIGLTKMLSSRAVCEVTDRFGSLLPLGRTLFASSRTSAEPG